MLVSRSIVFLRGIGNRLSQPFQDTLTLLVALRLFDIVMNTFKNVRLFYMNIKQLDSKMDAQSQFVPLNNSNNLLNVLILEWLLQRMYGTSKFSFYSRRIENQSDPLKLDSK